MPLFGLPPLFGPLPLPPQRRPPFLPSVTPATSIGTGSASATSTATGVSAGPGVGTAAATSTATAVGQAVGTTTGTASATSTATASPPTTNIFPLTVEASGRYFKQNDGTPFLVCADTTWSLAVNIPSAGVNTFLDNIVAKGFNAVMMNAIEHHYTVVKAPKDVDGNLPFTQKMDGSSYTGSPNGTPSASGTQAQFSADAYSNINNQAPDPTFINNTYWTRVEAILTACLDRNIAVLVWPMYLGFHGNQEGWISELVVWDAVTGAGGFTGQSFANASKSKLWNYGAWLSARWASYPNIIWVAGGDYGSGGQTLNTAQADAVANCIDGIQSVAAAQSIMWTAHWDRPCITEDTAITGVTWDLNFGYADDATAELCRRAYASSPTKPAILGEYFYEDGSFGGSPPYRRYMYWGFLGAIGGGFFGHEQLWRFDDGSPGTDYTTILATQGTLDASRLFVFWKTKPWHRLRPNGLNSIGTLITAGGGTASPQSTDYVAAAATPEGDLLLAYYPPAHTGSATVDTTKLASMAVARWFDPTNATFTAIGAFNNTGTHAFTTTGNNSAGDADWLLVLDVAVGSAAATSTATGVAQATGTTTGTASATSTATAVGQAQAITVGTASATSTATGVSVAAGVGTGTASATSTATAVGQATGTTTGSAAATGAAAAVGQALGVGTGTSTGTSTANATGQAIGTTVGSASATSTALAFQEGLNTGTGSAAGTSTATGVGQATGTATGTGSATSTAAGVALALGIGVGSSSGTSTAIAVGQAQGVTVGSAAATSTALAVAPGIGIGTAFATSTALGVAQAFAITVGSSSATSTAHAVGTALGLDPWLDIQDAIYEWIEIGSGLDTDHIIWCPEGVDPGPAPTGTYIELRLINIERVSDDWFKLSRSGGGAITTSVRGTRHPTLQLTCIAGERYGSQQPSKILERVLTSVSLPSVRAILRGKVGIGVRGRINVITARRSGLFDPRAMVEVGLHTVIEVSEVQPTGGEMLRASVETPKIVGVKWVPDPPE